jgi:DNA primase catalytic subunit
MAETKANDEGETRAGEQERPREDEGELKAEQESAEAMDADVPHPPGFEKEEGRRA